ncbi:hypothetical protein [Methylobacterium sp. 22177]|uniref:hypothetical protein n=1 Tax=Methylobacterium sp. 22177 TaxID=3453885 RepID=UPI003F855A57
MTVIHAAWVVQLRDGTAALVRQAATQLAAQWRETLMRTGRIRRDPRGYTRLVGTIELDLLHSAVTSSRMKAALLSEFGIDVGGLGKHDRVLVLHTHMLIDGRGHASWSDLERDLRAQWPGPRRVHVARLYDTGTVTENLNTLADYSTKFKFVYSKALLGQKSEFTGVKYEKAWSEYVMNAYREIGFDNLKISTLDSRAKGSRVYSDLPVSEGENSEIEAFQLTPDASKNEETTTHEPAINNDDEIDKVILEHMRAIEILPYINLNKMTVKTLGELCDALDRMSAGTSREYQLHVQYGDEEADLRIKQARVDLEHTSAEVERLRAEAAKDYAAAEADDLGS